MILLATLIDSFFQMWYNKPDVGGMRYHPKQFLQKGSHPCYALEF